MKWSEVTRKYAHTNTYTLDAEPLKLRSTCRMPWTLEGSKVGELLKIRRDWANDKIDAFGLDLTVPPVKMGLVVSAHASGVPGLRPLLIGLHGEGCGWVNLSERRPITKRTLADGLGLANHQAFEWEIIADVLNFLLGQDLNGEEVTPAQVLSRSSGVEDFS